MGCEAMASIKQEEENSKRTAVATPNLLKPVKISKFRWVVKLWQVLNKKKKTAKGLLWPLGPSMLTRAIHRGVVHHCTFKAQHGNASGSRNPMASIKQEEENSKRTAVATRPLHA